MKRIKCTVAYDGSNFQGYQVQPNKRTVQGEIEQVLKKLNKGEFIRIAASGRTDAQVHAKGQVIHFDTEMNLSDEQWMKALNSLLPGDISVLRTESVDEQFHARFSSVAKEYRYRVYTAKERDPFIRNYAYHYPYPLDVNAMKQAMEHIVGTHEFTSFCSAKTEIEDHVRTINLFELHENADELIFQIRGSGFLYNMVRIIVGTMLEVGAGKRSANDIPDIIKGRDRSLAGRTAPGHGLYLWEVFYK